MRLIDADAFKEYIRVACEEMSHVYKDGGKWAKQITEDFCIDIDEQPTIEEQKTGKWINAYPDIEPNPMLMYGICSVCGFEQSISDKLQYCPNCGARMVQEGEDNDS